MPLKYNGHIYKTWSGLIRAIKTLHPAWPMKRVNTYAGGLKKRQEGRNKPHGK